MECLYGRDRIELINDVTKWLKDNGYDTAESLNYAGELVSLTVRNTFEADLEVIVSNMLQNKDIYSKMSKSEIEILVAPFLLADEDYEECGPRTKLLCFRILYIAVCCKSISGNLRIDIRRAVEKARMHVENELDKDSNEY